MDLLAAPRKALLRRTATACLLALAMTTLAPGWLHAQGASGAEIKAAFLLNFAKFIQWPDGGGPPERAFTIGVLGDDAVADALRELSRGKAAGRRPVLARRVTIKDGLADLHILFVGESEEPRVADVLSRANAGSVVTVSDLDRFCALGGIIQFRSERDRVRFDINLDQAERLGLVIDSKLLALARTVLHTAKTAGASQ
jgi:hypothetical protein